MADQHETTIWDNLKNGDLFTNIHDPRVLYQRSSYDCYFKVAITVNDIWWLVPPEIIPERCFGKLVPWRIEKK